MQVQPANRPQPGYVYALENLALPGLVKVGHTHRPPHKRALELSRTAVPLPFEVSHARFFWNAPGVEAALHRHFAPWRRNRRREFFSLPIEQITQVMDSLDHGLGMAPMAMEDHDPDACHAWRVADPDWGVSREGLEEQWGWAEEELASGDLSVVRRGWARMEALSAGGWDEGTWRLANRMMLRDPSLEMARRAAWVLDAAACQGHPAAALRASWLRSFWDEAHLIQWKADVERAAAQLLGRDPLAWPGGVRETLEAELRTWNGRPERVIDHPLFEALSRARLARGPR